MIPKQNLTILASRSDYEKLELVFWIRVKPRKIGYAEIFFHGGVAKFVNRKNTPPADTTCSSSLNGSDLEQIVHNIIRRLSLEWVDIWNKCL